MSRLGGGVNVVLYHHIADQTPALAGALGVTTPTALFEAHIRRLERRYEIVDLDQVLTGRLPRRALLITFDDGYRSVADVAVPVLERLGLPSVFFVSAAFVEPGSLPLDNLVCHLVDRFGLERVVAAVAGLASLPRDAAQLLAAIAALPYARRMQLPGELAERFEVAPAELRERSGLYLDASELAGLPARGCEIANHTRSHLSCRSIVDESAAHEQLVSHRAQLEAWAQSPVRAFSYPYGNRADATPLVERALRASGHEVSFLVEARPNPRGGAQQVLRRVSLDSRPLWRVAPELELLPRLRSARDRLRPTTAGS